MYRLIGTCDVVLAIIILDDIVSQQCDTFWMASTKRYQLSYLLLAKSFDQHHQLLFRTRICLKQAPHNARRRKGG